MKKIVIAGGNGQIGSLLVRHFTARGDLVVILSRRALSNKGAVPPWRTVAWDGESAGSWTKELEAADALINLSGRSVNCRYGPQNRREILNSRVQSTTILGEVIGTLKDPPKLWMNASTATIYRHAFDKPMDEATGELGGREADAPDTWRFSIEVARRWEEAFSNALTPLTRKVALRSAMTMSPDRGGIFDVLLRLVRLGLGGRQASGKQFVSWIHEADFRSAIDFLIAREELQGPVNLAAPHPLPNNEFMRTLREAWGTRIGLPATRWMLEIGAFAMRTETELILKSRRVVPVRLSSANFQFQFPHWKGAAADLVARVKVYGQT